MQEAHCEWITGHVIYSFISLCFVFFITLTPNFAALPVASCCSSLVLFSLRFVLFFKLFAFVFLFVSRSGSHDVMIVEHRKRCFHLTFVMTECISTPLLLLQPSR